MRLGILGGTFDPIHVGHLLLAEEAGEDLGLERVYLIPAAQPPHKGGMPVTPFFHRLTMTQIAARESPLFDAHDLEGRRQGPSYSIETLRDFRRLFNTPLDLFFILGTDAFLEIETWKDYQRLFEYAHFVVIRRPGFSLKKMGSFLDSLDLGFKSKGRAGVYALPGGNELIFREATLMDISSTRIRERVGKGQSIRFLVSEGVRAYIMENGLYRGHGDYR